MKHLCAIVLVATGVMISAAEYTVRVESAAHSLSNVVITMPVPDEAFPQVGYLSTAGERVSFQRTIDGQFAFVLPFIDRQSMKTFSVIADSLAPNAGSAQAKFESGRVAISVGGKKAFVYQAHESEPPRADIKELFKRGGYIHPVYSPSGRVITDDYPPNHIHHHGIWFPWTKTSFEGRETDFWNMGEGKGKVEFVKLGKHWSGPVHAGFSSEHRFIDLMTPERKVALNEAWTVTAFNVPRAKYFTFDLVSTQTCASSSALTLPKYHYGGLGLRGNWAWNGEGNCSFLTSEGESDRVKGNETRGNWCHMGGEVEGERTGITVLSHPSNFRAPQPMRLHPTEPFFCFAPSQLGDWKIEPGKAYVSRYRFIVSDGPADRALLDRLWVEYATPPKVSIEKH